MDKNLTDRLNNISPRVVFEGKLSEINDDVKSIHITPTSLPLGSDNSFIFEKSILSDQNSNVAISAFHDEVVRQNERTIMEKSPPRHIFSSSALPLGRQQFSKSQEDMFKQSFNPEFSIRSQPPGMTLIEPIERTPVPGELPPFVFIPPKWVYQDTEGRIQGPFNVDQMASWYKSQYFPADLPIKCDSDSSFYPLFKLIQKYGPQNPFFEFLIDREQFEKQIYFQKLNSSKSNFTAPVFGQVQQPKVFPMRQTQVTQNFELDPALLHQIASLPPHEQQAFLYHLQQQKIGAETSLQSKQSTSPPIANKPISPINLDSSSVHVSREVNASKTAFSSKLKSQTEPDSASSISQDRAILSDKTADTDSQQQITEIQPPKKPAHTPAPWAKRESTNTESTLKSLKEIQALETERMQTLEKQREIEAKKRLAIEVANIASRNSALVSNIPIQSTWASKAGVSPKKSLVEIMEEEQKRKTAAQKTAVKSQFAAHVKASGPNKGPAGWSTSPDVAVNPKTVHASLVSTSQNISPHDVDNNIAGNGRNVVDKKLIRQSSSVSGESSIPKPAQMAKTSSINPQGASEELIIWCRNALRGVQKEASFSGINIRQLILQSINLFHCFFHLQ